MTAAGKQINERHTTGEWFFELNGNGELVDLIARERRFELWLYVRQYPTLLNG